MSSVVPGAWTIAVETIFYALFPLVVWSLRSWQVTALALIGTIGFAILLYPITIEAVGRIMPNESADILRAFSFSWFPTQLPAFLAGVLVYHLLREFRASPPRRVLEAAVVFAIATAAILPLFSLVISSKILLLMAYVLDFGLFALCLGQGAGTVLIGRPIRYLGTISYSAYFWHFVALWVLARLDLMPDRWPLSPWLQFLAG
jgi:peptidoglycan/LPS O-acetylase OafA/YrhL